MGASITVCQRVGISDFGFRGSSSRSRVKRSGVRVWGTADGVLLTSLNEYGLLGLTPTVLAIKSK